MGAAHHDSYFTDPATWWGSSMPVGGADDDTMFGLTPEQLTGPLAALFIMLVIVVGFYTGRILPRNTVRREDQDALLAINANYSVTFGQQTEVVRLVLPAIAGLREDVAEVKTLMVATSADVVALRRPASRR